MTSEWSILTSYYIHNILNINEQSNKQTIQANNTNLIDIRGYAMTSKGPGSYPNSGCILENPQLLWAEDKWNEDKEKEALIKIKQQGLNFTSIHSLVIWYIYLGSKLPVYWKDKYINKANTYWHEFYKRNKNHFYKDRHYLHIVFPELDISALSIDSNSSSIPTYLLEVGCGVGNSIFPLIECNNNLIVVAIDFAKSAIDILNESTLSKPIDTADAITDYLNHYLTNFPDKRIYTKVCNIVNDIIPVPNNSMDYIMCMFVLSAISPIKHIDVLKKLSNSLKTNGKIFIRDYGRYDEAQLRFKNNLLDDNFYVRQDGTCAYYFDINELRTLITQHLPDIIIEECEYILRQYANRSQKIVRYRVWIHVKLRKI